MLGGVNSKLDVYKAHFPKLSTLASKLADIAPACTAKAVMIRAGAMAACLEDARRPSKWGGADEEVKYPREDPRGVQKKGMAGPRRVKNGPPGQGLIKEKTKIGPTERLGEKEGGSRYDVRTMGEDSQRRVQAKVIELLFGNLASSTRSAYALGWKHWVQYRESREAPIFLDTSSPDKYNKSERDLLEFIAGEAVNFHLRPGTIRVKVYAIRHMHIVNGQGNILDAFPRIQVALKSLKKEGAQGARKMPVDRRSLARIAGAMNLGQVGRTNDPSHAAVWAHICLAFFFLLRHSEAQALRADHVKPMRKGDHVNKWGEEDAVQIMIESSKCDQLNAGCIRTQGRVGGIMCPAWAVRNLRKVFPTVAQEGYDGPLCTEDGIHPIHRDSIQAWLKYGAEANGIPADRIGTHSLRIGGATALYNIGWECWKIQRFGRWKSDAFHGYLWDKVGEGDKTSTLMANAAFTLHAGILLKNTKTGVTKETTFQEMFRGLD
jgi:integrase